MELKFRAWWHSQKQMLNVRYIEFGQLSCIVGENSDGKVFTPIKKVDVSLMQSTGLFDKNGVEIFEGDVVEYEGKERTVVVFGQGMFKLKLNTFFSAPLGKAKKENIKVLGNVYENPELVEET